MAEKDIRGLFYGHFHKWDAMEHIKICEDIGWKRLDQPPEGSWVDYENCDMRFIDIREHIKYLKYGYGRATDQLNIELRNGRISRKEALEIVRDVDGNFSDLNKELFCSYIDITAKQFDKIVDSFVNTELFEKVDGKWKSKFIRS